MFNAFILIYSITTDASKLSFVINLFLYLLCFIYIYNKLLFRRFAWSQLFEWVLQNTTFILYFSALYCTSENTLFNGFYSIHKIMCNVSVYIWWAWITTISNVKLCGVLRFYSFEQHTKLLWYMKVRTRQFLPDVFNKLYFITSVLFIV